MAHRANEKMVGQRPCKAQSNKCCVAIDTVNQVRGCMPLPLGSQKNMALNVFTLNLNVIVNIVNLTGFILPWKTRLWGRS